MEVTLRPEFYHMELALRGVLQLLQGEAYLDV